MSRNIVIIYAFYMLCIKCHKDIIILITTIVGWNGLFIFSGYITWIWIWIPIISYHTVSYCCFHTRIGRITKVTRLLPCFSAEICPLREWKQRYIPMWCALYKKSPISRTVFKSSHKVIWTIYILWVRHLILRVHPEIVTPLMWSLHFKSL